MILDLTKGFVPEVYSDSRDYRVFLKLLSVLTTVMKDRIDSIPILYSADDCPSNMLHLLASMVGYTYVESRSIESNRMIIKHYPEMLRNRGNRVGIKMAVALSLNSLTSAPTYSLDNIIIEYDHERSVIKIYYPNVDLFDKDLMEAVRPLGSRLDLIKSHISTNTEELDVKVDVYYDKDKWRDSRTEVEKSKVGLGDVDPNDYKKNDKEVGTDE